jgi:hypothetical protein
VTHLQQLPDPHALEHRADATRRHQEGVGGEHELVQAREERPVLEGLRHEGVHVLLEGHVDANPDGLRTARDGRGAARRSAVQPSTST